MFEPTWNKYLPIIKILMKRSATAQQILDMNFTDFQRAAGGRKVKFTFSINLHKGRIQNITNPPPLARDLSVVLQENTETSKLVRQYDYDFSLNSSFQLTIKNSTPIMTEADSVITDVNGEENNPSSL